MHIVIVTEKPAIARAIAPHARAHWPGARITLFSVVPYANILHRYPRGLKWSDLPFVGDFQVKLNSPQEWSCKPFDLDESGQARQMDKADLDLIAHANEVIFACDPDPTGVHAFALLVEGLIGQDRTMRCPALWLYSLDDASIERQLQGMKLFGEVAAQALAAARVKRHFDFNWNTNSLAVLSRMLREVGAAADAPPVSKYALQLLYALRGRAALSEGALIQLMSDWPGTGRYTNKSIPPHGGRLLMRPSLGSTASRFQIVENLVRSGLLQQVGQGSEKPAKLAISAMGKAFLSALHPDCEDFDMPFRLDAWQRTGDTSRPAIDRYIRTFFGKQIRFSASR